MISEIDVTLRKKHPCEFKVYFRMQEILEIFKNDYAPVICNQGPGNSGDFDFLLCKARLYVQHCRVIFMVKVLPKASGHGIKNPADPQHCGDDTELKAWH